MPIYFSQTKIKILEIYNKTVKLDKLLCVT